MYLDRIKWKTQPREYQKQAITNFVKDLTTKGYHAGIMDMGTGKTKCSLNAAEILIDMSLVNAVVIIASKSLIEHVWLPQIEEHTYLNAETVIWKSSKAKSYIQELRQFLVCKRLKILLINPEAFQISNPILDKFFEQFMYKNPQTMVIFDESSKIKNPKANRTKKITKVFKSAKYKLALTGTMITNSILDAYTQFEFLRTGFWPFKNYYMFKKRYSIMENEYAAGGRRFLKVVGFKRVDEFMTTIIPHCTILKKEDCLDLPDKIYQKVFVELNSDQKRLYEELKSKMFTMYKDELLTMTNAVAMFTRLRQIVSGFMPDTGTKIGSENQKIKFILEDSEEYEGKIIIWANLVSEIKNLHEAITNKYKSQDIAVMYYGECSDKEVLTKFEKDDKCKFLIISPKIGAYGLNLQFCSLVYFFSRSPSPEENWQAEDRTHRIGQTNNPVYKDIIAKDTVDERIIELLEYKKDLKENFTSMSLSDIINIV